MDAFEALLAELGIHAEFGPDNTLNWTLTQDAGDTSSVLLTVRRDLDKRVLRFAVSTQNILPEINIPAAFFQEFGERALRPIVDEYGIGLFPGSGQISVYQVIPLSGQNKASIQLMLETLVDVALYWDNKIRALTNDT